MMQIFKEYLDQIEDVDKKEKMNQILSWISLNYPNLETKIAWKQPMFIDHGTFIIGFSYAKEHISIAPEVKAIEAFNEKAKDQGYQTTQQLIKIKWKQPINFQLLKEIIDFNIDLKKDIHTFWNTEK